VKGNAIEFGFEGDEPFLAMEFLPGESLESWLRQPRALPAQLRVVRGLAEALGYAHAHGVLHRDVKPGNVQVLPDGQCKLMDFGIARAALGHLTAAGTVMGTPNYMAPESISEASYSERSDLYSAAVVFWEMFAGRNPFAAPSVAACLHNALHLDPEPLTRLRPDLPAALSSAIMECLAKDPARRPASLERLLAAVQAVETGTTASPGDTARELLGETRFLPRGPGSYRPSARQVLFGLAAVVLVGLGAFWLTRREPPAVPSPLPEVTVAAPATTLAPPPATPAPQPTALPATPTPDSERKAASAPPRPSPTPVPSAPPVTTVSVLVPSVPPATLPSAAPTPRPTPTASAAPELTGPALSELKPRFVRKGSAGRLELRGSGFGPGLKVLVLHGNRPATGVRVTGLHVHDASHATATLVVDSDVALDSYVVVATDGVTTSNGITLEVQL